MRDPDDTPTLAARIAEVVREQTRAGWDRTGRSLSAVGARLDAAMHQLLGPRVRDAVERGVVGPDRHDVARELRAVRSSSLVGQVGRTTLPRVARRLAPVRAATRRSPVGMAVWLGPGFYEAVTVGVRDLEVVAAHLAGRAREAGVEPDPDRIHATAVQLLTGSTIVRPGAPPDHGALVRWWIRRGLQEAVPFGLMGGRTDADHLADRCAELDPAQLGDPVLDADSDADA